MPRTRLNGFSVFLFVVAAAGFVIVVLTAREVLQDAMANPRFQNDPGYRGDAINGYVVYVATQFSQLVVTPLGIGVAIQYLSRMRRP